MTDPTPRTQAAEAAIAALIDAVRMAQDAPLPDPRLVAAETVAAAALHLINQWGVWAQLEAAALGEISTRSTTEGEAREALAALELLDVAVRVWAPHAHPAVDSRALLASGRGPQGSFR